MVQADENDMREYMRCILSDRLFTKTYTIGEQAVASGLKCTFGVLTNEEADRMDRLIGEITSRENDTGRNKISAMQKTKLLFYLKKWGDEEFSVPPAEVGEDSEEVRVINADDVHKMFVERFGSRSELVSTIGMRLVVTFEQLVAVLTQSVFDESFWQGAGLV